MISTKNLVNNCKAVPSTWIFQHYCKIKEKLIGQDIKIRSIFNPKDKTPSMAVYFDTKTEEYRFKDFSTGKGGSGIDLVKELKGVDYRVAVMSITEDYNAFILHNNGGYNVDDFKVLNKYQVTDHKLRSWNTADQYLWTQFYIGSKLLNEHFVRPFSSYTMTKEENGEVQTVVINGDYIYGFFTKEGILYKIYQPKLKEKKYIKVQHYIQGTDQLKGYDYLAITSGLKDIMSLKSMKLQIDYIAPDSENTMLPKELIAKYLKTYKKVFVLFDNDEAGIKAMKKYRDEYGLTCILLNMANDPAECLKAHGPVRVIQKLVPMINQHICES